MTKRFIWILTFCLAFLAGKADTIGHNHVYLRDSMIADFREGEVIKVKLDKSDLDATDFLVIDRFFGCGGTPISNGILIIRDSVTSEVIYRDTISSISEFRIPLDVLHDYQRPHPGTVFTGSCVAMGVSEVSMGYRYGVKFEIRLE